MKRLLALLLLSVPMLAQNFALNDASTYPASRIWLNIGAENYYNAYLRKNLIKVNPGMQPQIVRQIKTCVSGSTTTCVTGADYDSMPVNYAVGWSVYVACHGGQGSSPGTCAGGAFGQTTTVTSNTVNNTGTGSTTYTFTALSAAIAANDSIWLIRPTNVATLAGEFTWPDFGWQPDLSGTGTATIDVTGADFPATLAGFANPVQVVELKTTAGSSSAGMHTFFDTSGSLYYNFTGGYHYCVDIKVKSGTPGNVTLSVNRSGGVNASMTVAPTGGWNTYCGTFTGSETTSTGGGNVQIGMSMSPAGAADIVVNNAVLTADADTSTTAYTNSFITNMGTVNPGGLRYNADGLEGTSLLNWITPAAYRQTSSVIAAYGGAQAVQQGLQEFLQMAQSLSLPAVSISVPPTFSATDWANLTEYLGGASGSTWGARRAALGQTNPWTSVFSTIILEVGNETWNTTLNVGQSSYQQYSVSATAYWNYTRTAIAACGAVKTSGSYSSVIKCGASTQTAVGAQQGGYINSADTSHYIDLLNANEYGQFTVTSCGIPNQYTSAFVEPYANTLSGSASGFYQTYATGIPVYVYEYNNSTNSGSCTQAQINGYPEGEGYGLVNTLMPLHANKTLGVTAQAVWQLYQPSQGLSTSGGATSINEWGVFTGPNGAFTNARGTALAMSVVNGAISTGNTGFAVTPSGVTTFNFSSSNGVNSVTGVPYLQAFAFKTGSTRSLVVENIDQSNSYSFTVSGTNSPSGTITRKLYNSTNVNDACEGANASPCNFVSTSTVSAGSYSIPAHSIVTLSWTVAPTTNVEIYTPPPTAGQPWFALKGFQHNHWAQVYPDTINASTQALSWTITGNIPVITTANTWSNSDFVQPQNFALTGNGNLNEQIFYISAATLTNMTLSGANGNATGGAESSPARVRKIGPGTVTGTWAWVNTGSTPANVTLTSIDGNRTNTGTSASLAAEQPFIKIVFNTDGACTETGTSGSYATTSTVKGNLVFTSDADNTKTATYPYVVCAPGGNSGKLAIVYAMTGYRQAFKSTKVIVRARVRGNSNRGINWTITGSPVGANGTLAHTSSPHAVFSTGTVTGQYTFHACAAADATACDDAVVYVAAQTIAAANPDKTEQVPCENDSTAGFTVYQVGPTKTYANVSLVPLNAVTGPTMVQIFNEGGVGSPTTYHAYTQFKFNPALITTAPTVHRPLLVICRVPNATSGENPVEDGTNAIGPSWLSPAFNGASMFFTSNTSPLAYYSGATLPLKYVSITNAHIINVNFGIPFTDYSGAAQTWGDSSALRYYNCEYCHDIGTYTYNVAIPMFEDANSANNAWGGGSFHIIHEGFNLRMSGSSGRSTEHPIYTQPVDSILASGQIQGAIPGAQGNVCWSSRASTLIVEYVTCKPEAGATGGDQGFGTAEIQNFPRYILASGTAGASYFGQVGDTSGESPYSNGDAWGANGLAALIEEHGQGAIVYGSTFYIQNSIKYIGEVNTNQIDTQIDGPIRLGLWYNTFAMDQATYIGNYPLTLVEQIRIGSPGSGTPDPRPVVWPVMSAANNIFAMHSNVGCSNQSSTKCYTLTSKDTDFAEFLGKNLVAAGQMSGTGSITQQYKQTQFPGGMYNDVDDMDYTGGVGTVLNFRWKNFTAANFASYASYTFGTVPTEAVGIATACDSSSLACLYQPWFQSVDANGVTADRTDLTTVGSQDPSGPPPPTPVSIAVTPNPLTTNVSTSGSLTCTTTLSDASTRSCISPACTSTNTGSMTISGLNWTATATPGTGTLNCSAETLMAPGDAFTVNAVSTGTVKFSGNIKVSGNIKIAQ